MATYTFRIESEKKQRFHELAKKINRKPAALINAMIDQVLKTQGLDQQEEVDTENVALVEAATKKITARITPSEYAEACATAKAESMRPGTWLAALVRGRLRKRPTLNKDELVALRESTRQLQAIGRNLNQLVRATNIEWREAERLKREHVKRLADDIKTHTERVGAILSGNATRWTE